MEGRNEDGIPQNQWPQLVLQGTLKSPKQIAHTSSSGGLSFPCLFTSFLSTLSLVLVFVSLTLCVSKDIPRLNISLSSQNTL